MRYFTLLISLLCLIPLHSSAQSSRTATVSGTVIDADDQDPIVGAIVTIDGSKHGVTDPKGLFSITGVPVQQDSARVEIRFMGYKTEVRSIKVTAPRTAMGTISLAMEAQSIGDVVVKAPTIIAIQKGDTVQFNASSFKTNPDADAADLVSKMPGIRVTGSGVESQGEAIARVYVDGKLLFGDNAMSALNNLPADAVESIQVFDELSDEAKFTGFDDGNRSRAMNVVTKNKVNRSTIARVNGGYGRLLENNALSDGRDGLFNFRANGSSFSEKNRITLFANSSNIETGRGGGGGGVGTNRDAGIGLFNKWNEKIELTANYRYSDGQSVRSSYQVTDYYPTDQFESRIYRDTTYSKSRTISHNADLRLEYKINKNNRLFFAPRFSVSDPTSMNMRRSSNVVDGAVNSITNTDNTSKGTNFNNSGMLTYSHVFSKPGRFLSSSVNYNFSNNDTDARQVDTTATTTKPRNLNTITDNSTNRVSARVMYGEPLSKTQQLGFSYTFEYENSESDKRAYDFLVREYDNLDPSLSNNFSRKYFTHTGGLAYNLNVNSSRLNVGLDFRNARLLKDQFFPTIDKQNRSLSAWLPRAEYRYEIRKSRNLRVNYRTSSPIPSVEQFQNVINTSNLLQLTAGNPGLKPSYNHTLSLSYSSSNTEKSTTYFLRFSAGTTVNRISNKTTYFTEETILPQYGDFVAQKGSQLTIPVNLNGHYTGSITTGYSFTFKPIRTNINLETGYNFSRVPSYTGNLLNKSNQHGATFRVGFVSNVSENVDFNITSDTRFTYASNSAKTNNNYLEQTVSAEVNLIFLGGFVLNNNFSYQYTHSGATTSYSQNFSLWNVGIGRKFLRKRQAEVRVTVYDLLKQRKSLTHTVGDNYIQDQWNNIRGRYVMATFSYRFNSLSNLSRNPGNQPEREFRGPPPGGQGFPGGGEGRPMRDGGGEGGGYRGGGGGRPF